MKRKRSCQESEATWKRLLELSRWKQQTKNATPSKNDGHDDNDDPFDCRSLAVPPTRTLVENVLQEYVQKWKALDDRRLVKAHSNDDIESEESLNNNEAAFKTKMMKRGGWDATHTRQLRLPHGFDYTTSLKAPPSISHEKGDQKVIDLLDPTRQLSYHQELWKLFASVPTVEDIKKRARSNAHIPKTMHVYNEIVEGTKRVPRLDAHGLSRLRMADRHGLPPTTTPEQEGSQPKTSTIRFEFLKRQLKRGSYGFLAVVVIVASKQRYPHPFPNTRFCSRRSSHGFGISCLPNIVRYSQCNCTNDRRRCLDKPKRSCAFRVLLY